MTNHAGPVDLVVCGTVGLDDITTPFGAVTGVLGGSASYSAMAASYFCQPGLISIVGTDFSDDYRHHFSDHSVDLAGLAIHGQTFRWQGSYEFDLAEATTLGTQLNSLAEFKAILPLKYQKAPVLLLANTDPTIQSALAEQLPEAFTILDTMNFWITGQRFELLKAIKLADVLVVNDAEARQLTDEVNLIKAAKALLAFGPEFVIIKKGEHGALLVSTDSFFATPGYPLEVVKDPTGCGDSFAGALAGYLACQSKRDEATLRKAVVYGSALASFCAEDFSVNRLVGLAKSDIEERYHAFEQFHQF